MQESELGTPQGAVISPLLSNLYLNDLDHEAARQDFAMVRYADDFVILCRSQGEAERALAWVRGQVEAKGLTLHPEKTRLVDATQKGGFDFLGWFGYFKYSHKTTFGPIDSWVRMRLRSILRKRAGRKGRGRGADHHRWKNAFFAEQGLFGLAEAHALACQS